MMPWRTSGSLWLRKPTSPPAEDAEGACGTGTAHPSKIDAEPHSSDHHQSWTRVLFERKQLNAGGPPGQVLGEHLHDSARYEALASSSQPFWVILISTHISRSVSACAGGGARHAHQCDHSRADPHIMASYKPAMSHLSTNRWLSWGSHEVLLSGPLRLSVLVHACGGLWHVTRLSRMAASFFSYRHQCVLEGRLGCYSLPR